MPIDTHRSLLLHWPTFKMSLTSTYCMNLLADFGAQNLGASNLVLLLIADRPQYPSESQRTKEKLRSLRETCMAKLLHDPWRMGTVFLSWVSYTQIHNEGERKCLY